jgi:catalase
MLHGVAYRTLVLIRNVMVKVKFTLQQAMNAQRGRRGTALLLFDLDARWDLVVNATPQQKDAVPIAPKEGGLGANLGRVRKI